MATSKTSEQKLVTHISEFIGTPPSRVESLADYFSERFLSKKQALIDAGQRKRFLAFILEGYFRIFAIHDGKEVTQWISSPGEFLTDLGSTMFGMPARWYIEALTDARIMIVESDQYDKMCQEVKEWERIEKLFISKCFLMIEDRVFSFLSYTAEERFQRMMSYRPELFNEVPLHMLASVLGMSPETLSRIRRKPIS